MKVVRPRVSYTDLLRAPEDGRRYEIYDGAVFVVPSPLPVHQLVALNLEDLFRAWTRQHGGIVLVSPIDIVFTEYNVIEPDVVFFSPARRHHVDPWKVIRNAPDITIEVLSPSTARIDRGRKMQLLARFGAAECWLVDPKKQTVEVYALKSGAYALAAMLTKGQTVRSVAVPGIEFPSIDVQHAGRPARA